MAVQHKSNKSSLVKCNKSNNNCNKEPRNGNIERHMVYRISAARVHYQGHRRRITYTQAHEIYSG